MIKPYFYLCLCLALCACNAQHTSYAYITNQGEHTVSLINTASNQVTDTIQVGKAPVGIAVSKNLKRAYISNVEGQSISVIDTTSQKMIDSIKIQGSPVGLALSADSSMLYVASPTAHREAETAKAHRG